MMMSVFTNQTAAGSGPACLSADGLDAIAVYFPKPVIAGSQRLEPGNYTISALRGPGHAHGEESARLRLQSEHGDTFIVRAMRYSLRPDQLISRSEVVLLPAALNGFMRLSRVSIEGSHSLLLVPA